MVFIDYANADRINKLDTVWINGEEFKGIGYNGLLTVNTKTYVSEPTRANDGSMPNIGDHETFIVPRCKINFKYFNLEDYRRLCNAILPNEFLVKYYDKDFGDFVEHWMYCEPREMTKIYNVGTAIIGVLDFEVSFIGTLNKRNKLSIKYETESNSFVIKNLHSGQYYNSITEYTLGDRVKHNDKYYEAIFYNDTFKGVSPPSLTYWTKLNGPANAWSKNMTYSANDLVYLNSNSEYSFYECIKGNTGADVNDTEFWKRVKVGEYNSETEYKLGDYVYIGTITSDTYYKAKYEQKTFKSVHPDNNKYWKYIPYLSEITVDWGQSIILADPLDLFESTNGQPISDKWQICVVKNGENQPTNSYYYANQSVSILRNMVLKPTLETQ